MGTQLTAPPLRLLTIQNRGGSRQHFYHFFFGVLLPLCDYLAVSGDADAPLIVRNCGPLDAILHELSLPGLLLADARAHEHLRDTLPWQTVHKVGLIGFDLGMPHHTYDREGVLAGAAWLLARCREAIDRERAQTAAQWPERPRVLIVDRGEPEAFYTSWLSERPKRGVGAQRRRVANHDEMVAEVTRRYPGCRSVLLEGRTLAAQIALFQLADVVIAQHGAALANMVWVRRDANVIELDGGEPKRNGFFSRLATTLPVPYRYFHQDGPFGAIDGAELSAAIDQELAGRTFA